MLLNYRLLKPALIFAVCAFYALVLNGSILAYPTSINNIPTAETLDKNTLLMEAGSYGYPGVLGSESTEGLMLQYGVNQMIEIGTDFYSAEGEHDSYFNLKARLISEEGRRPSLAVGLMDVASGDESTLYAVGTKSIGSIRMHLGVINSSYSNGVMAGLDLDVGENLWFGADYLPGSDNYLRIGASRSFGSDTWLTFSIGFPNSSDSEKEFGLTISTYIPLKGIR